MLAADRRVVAHRDGKREVHTVRKLFRLGPAAAVATSGAAVGIWISRFLSRLFARRAAFPLCDLESYALSVFQKEYDAFQRQGARWFAAHPDAHRFSYVLMGGAEDGGRCRFDFFASERHGERYRALATSDVLTAPRRIGWEGRLARLAREGADPEAIVHTVVEGMRRVADREDTVGGPYDLVVIDRNGLRALSFEE